jgi:hypothetical protein
MSNLFVREIVGNAGGDLRLPADDTELATATTRLDTQLQTIGASFKYDRVVAWVETTDGGTPRTLNCLVERFTYDSGSGDEECPSSSETQTMTAAIETAIEAYDSPNTTVGSQDVHIFASVPLIWDRDTSGGFVYPTNATDDVVVGSFSAPAGKWFNDGDMVLGGSTMVGTEVLRSAGHIRIEGGTLMAEDSSVPIAVTAGHGEFWVEDISPPIPKFTNDTPSDNDLIYVGGLGPSLPGISQIIHVDKTSASYTADGTPQHPYNAIASGIAAATALTPSASNPILLLIYPGVYSEAITTADGYVYFAGFSRESTIIRQTSGSSPPLTLADAPTSFFNLTFEVAEGTHTGRIVLCNTSLSSGKVRFINCAILCTSTGSPSNNYFSVTSTAQLDLEFHECFFSNNDKTQPIYRNDGTASVQQGFYDCDFFGTFYDGNSHSSSTLQVYQSSFESSNTSSTTGTVYVGTSRTDWFEFHGCKIVNTSTTGPAVYGGTALNKTTFSDCYFSGGSSYYDIVGASGYRPSIGNCRFTRGNSLVVPPDGIAYVGSGVLDVPYFQSIESAITCINATTSGKFRVVLLEDQTLAAQLTAVGASCNVIFDGRNTHTIDRAGATIIQVGASVTNQFLGLQLRGEIIVNGNGAKLYFEESRLEGRVLCSGSDANAVVRAHDSDFVGTSAYTSPLYINYGSGSFGAVYYSGCYLEGYTGNAAVLYGVDGSSNTVNFDALYMERTKCFHGSLGTNNPFGGTGQGGSPPVNNYYAHHCVFNQEPDVASPTYLANQIDTGQRNNCIDPDGDYTWLVAW